MNVWAWENNTGKDIRYQIELDKSYKSDIKEECYEKGDTGIKMLIPKEGTRVKHSVAVIN